MVYSAQRFQMRAGEDMAEVFLKTKDVARTIQEWGDLFSEVVRPGSF